MSTEYVQPHDSVVVLNGGGESNMKSAVRDVKHLCYQFELTYKDNITCNVEGQTRGTVIQ